VSCTRIRRRKRQEESTEDPSDHAEINTFGTVWKESPDREENTDGFSSSKKPPEFNPSWLFTRALAIHSCLTALETLERPFTCEISGSWDIQES